MRTVKISSRGQIVIPEEIRKKLGLKKGSFMRIALEDDKIVLIPLSEVPMAVVKGEAQLARQLMKESRSSDDSKLKALLKALNIDA
jgi:AbrB family looped-hinge helix DNA binding protein